MLLEDIGISYNAVNSDQKSLMENAQKIYETAAELFKKAKNSWNKIFRKSLKNNNLLDACQNRINSSVEVVKSNALVKNLLNNTNEENSSAAQNYTNNKNASIQSSNNLNNNISSLHQSNINMIFDQSKNNSYDDISNIDLKLIYEFSDKVDLSEIYPAFSKISNISKNFAEDLIEYFKILKNNDIIVFSQDELRKKTIIIPELNQYCFFITVLFYKLFQFF
jgi:hypothetical protein